MLDTLIDAQQGENKINRKEEEVEVMLWLRRRRWQRRQWFSYCYPKRVWKTHINDTSTTRLLLIVR